MRFLAFAIVQRKAAESLTDENGGDSFHEFPPRGVSSSPALARPRPGFFLRALRWIAACAAAAISLGAAAEPFAYVPNEGSGTIGSRAA